MLFSSYVYFYAASFVFLMCDVSNNNENVRWQNWYKQLAAFTVHTVYQVPHIIEYFHRIRNEMRQ